MRQASFRRLDCERKVVYATRAEAKQSIWKQRDKWATRMKVYRCPHSLLDGQPHYHIGRAKPN